MRTHSYGERDYAFGQAIVTLRTAINLTQVALAQFLGVSRGAVLGWEAGSSYPKAASLKRFIALCVRLQAFVAGREEEESRALWQAAHQKVRLDELWLSSLVGEHPPPLTHVVPGPIEGNRPRALPVAGPAPGRRVDWDDALDVPSFYGRQPELATVEQWIVQDLACGLPASALPATTCRNACRPPRTPRLPPGALAGAAGAAGAGQPGSPAAGRGYGGALSPRLRGVANSCQIYVTIVHYSYLFRFFDVLSLFVKMNEEKAKNTLRMLVPPKEDTGVCQL